MIHITERSGSSARQERVRKKSNGKKRRKCEKCVMLGTERGRMRANEWRNEGPEGNREGGREEKEEKRARIAMQRGARGQGRVL